MNNFLRSFLDWFKWQRVSADNIEFKNRDQEIILLIGYSVFYIIIGYLLGLVIFYFPLPILGAAQFNQDFWYSIIFKIVLLLLVPSFIYFKLWRYGLNNLLFGIKFSIKNSLATLLLATIGFFLNASHLKWIQGVIHNYPDSSLRLGVGILMPLLTAALPEELFFRGYLQTRLEQK